MNSGTQLKVSNKYSIWDMVNMDSEQIENKIFIVKKVCRHPNQGIHSCIRYVQIKQTNYIKNCCPKPNHLENEVNRSMKTILQIIDISDNILYDEIKA